MCVWGGGGDGVASMDKAYLSHMFKILKGPFNTFGCFQYNS